MVDAKYGTIIHLITNDAQYKKYLGKEISKEDKQKLPVLYVSEFKGIDYVLIQSRFDKDLNKNVEKLQQLNIIENNILPLSELKNFDNHQENDVYKIRVNVDNRETIEYTTDVQEIIVNDDNTQPAGKLQVNVDNTGWKDSEFGVIGEIPVGSNVALKVITIYCDTYQNNFTVERNMKPINVQMVKSKGKCKIKLEENIIKLMEQDKAELTYQINEEKQKQLSFEKLEFDYIFGDTFEVKLILKNLKEPYETTLKQEKVDVHEVTFEFKDELIKPIKYPVTFVAKYIGDLYKELTEDNPIVSENEVIVLVSINGASETVVDINTPIDVVEKSRIEYCFKKEGFEDRKGVVESVDNDLTITGQMNLKKYAVGYAITPKDSKIFIDGIERKSESAVDYWWHGETHTISVKSDNNNLIDFESEYTADSPFNVQIELQKKDVTINLYNEELKKPIDIGGIIISRYYVLGYENGKVVLEDKPYSKRIVKPADVSKEQFKAGEYIDVELKMPKYSPVKFERVCLNMESKDQTEYEFKVPYWRMPAVTILVTNQTDKEEYKNLKIEITSKETKESWKMTNGETMLFPVGEYVLEASAKGKETITRVIDLTEDYKDIFSLGDKPKEPAQLIITTYPGNAICEIEGWKRNKIDCELDDVVHVKVTGEFNYVTFEGDITVDDSVVRKHIELKQLPWKFRVITENLEPEQKNAVFYINDVERVAYETLTQERVTIIGKCEGYHDWIWNNLILKDTPLENEIVPEFIDVNRALPTQQFLDTVEILMKPKRYYNYLTIGKVFKREGYNIKSLHKFYIKFGKYCSSKTDFKIYQLCKNYFIEHPIPIA